MKHRPALLLAVLLYMTLDFSLPAMPGAFVFEAGDSVESIQGSRARTAAQVAAMPAEAGDTVVLSRPPAEYTGRLVRASRVEPRGRVIRTRRFLPRVDLSPPSEDAH